MAEKKIDLEDLINLKDGTTIDMEIITDKIDPAYALVKDEVDDFLQKPKIVSKSSKKNFFSHIPNSNLKKSIDSILKVRNVTEERIKKHLQFEFDMKMKRISKIKSKTYRRIKKRERIRKEMELSHGETDENDTEDKSSISCDDSENSNLEVNNSQNSPYELRPENSFKKESSEDDMRSKEYEIRPIISFKKESSEEYFDNENQNNIVKEAFSKDGAELNELEFLKEKKIIVSEQAPQIIETILPGWNEWAGEGIQIVKSASNSVVERKEGINPIDRQDFLKSNVIINENLQIPDKYKSELPYGFTTKNYVNYMKTPISLETNSLRVFNKFVKMGKKSDSVSGKNIEPNVYEPEY